MTAIRQRRLECGMTQKELGDMVGVTQNCISCLELEKFRPSGDTLQRLAAALNCDVAVIWTGPVFKKRVLSAEEQAARAANREKAAPYIERRKELGLTQKELAEKAGITRECVREIENGEHWPCWETRQKLRRAMGMPEERHFTEEERNAIFFQLEEQGLIRRAINGKWRKLRAAHVDFDDLYQELVICALRAIDRYQPDDRAMLKTFVERNMDFFIDTYTVKVCRHGLSGKVHYPLPEITVVSLDVLKADVGKILRELSERKGVEIIAAECCPDHIHMLVSIPPHRSVSQFVGYLKGKSSLPIFDRHANLKYKYGNRHFWCRGYYVDTVGKYEGAIKEYIRNQLE